MNAIGSFLRRSVQTDTQIQTDQKEKEARIISLRAAYRNIAALQTTTQLLIWFVLWLYGDAHHTSWQAMLMLLVPAVLLWLCWAFVPQRVPSALGTKLRLLLLPCLWMDALIFLMMLAMLCQSQLPTWPNYAVSIGLGIFTFATVAFSGKHGVAFGLSPIRWLLILFLVGSLVLHGMPRLANLWPFWGFGLGNTAHTALVGIGGVWGVASLFALPRETCVPTSERPLRSTLLWALLPILLVTVWAFYICMLRPWQGSIITGYQEKMIALNWYGGSLMLLTFSTLLWLILLPSSLSANVNSAACYVCEAFPKVPKRLVILLYLLPVVICSITPSDAALSLIQKFMPYRAALAAVAGIVVTLVERKKGL